MLKLFQLMMIGLFVWFIYSMLGKVFWLLPVLLLVGAGSNVCAAWFVRANPAMVARLCTWRLVDRYLSVVCSCTGDVSPGQRQREDERQQLLLHSAQDYAVAAARAKQVVRGHDSVIDEALTIVHDNQRLRRRRRVRGSESKPLASFLMVGGEGVGKRYLARVITKLLHRDGGVNVIPCRGLTAAQVFDRLNKEPSPAVLFENFDHASSDARMLVASMIRNGRAMIRDQEVCIDGILVFLSITSGSDTLSSRAENVGSSSLSRDQIQSTIESETLLDSHLLASLGGILHMRQPDDETIAEVAAMLMQKECSTHDIELTHVDPEILAIQVAKWSATSGFGAMLDRISRSLRTPLIAASESGQRLLSLRVRDEAVPGQIRS